MVQVTKFKKYKTWDPKVRLYVVIVLSCTKKNYFGIIKLILLKLFYLCFENKAKNNSMYLVLNGKILRQRMHGFFSLRKNCVKISKVRYYCVTVSLIPQRTVLCNTYILYFSFVKFFLNVL